jgi:hypothetical protein
MPARWNLPELRRFAAGAADNPFNYGATRGSLTITQVLIRRSQARIKDIIVRSTAKLTPGEVEAALGLHPDVKSAAVIGGFGPRSDKNVSRETFL